MKLTLHRTYRGPKYTIGHLYIDGSYFCDTIEDVDRRLSDAMPEAEIIRRKVPNETAIPTGTYQVSLKFVSGRFSAYSWARPYGGKIPRLMNVKGFEGILIHPGNDQNSTSGCLIVGENKIKGKVINSQATFHKLMGVMKGQQSISIEIL